MKFVRIGNLNFTLVSDPEVKYVNYEVGFFEVSLHVTDGSRDYVLNYVIKINDVFDIKVMPEKGEV